MAKYGPTVYSNAVVVRQKNRRLYVAEMTTEDNEPGYQIALFRVSPKPVVFHHEWERGRNVIALNVTIESAKALHYALTTMLAREEREQTK